MRTTGTRRNSNRSETQMQQTTDNESFLARLGDLAFRRRRLVVAVWIIGLLLAFGASSKLAGEWTADYETPGSDSKAAADVLDERFAERRPYSVDFVWKARDVTDRGVKQRVDGVLAKAQRLEGVGDGVSAADAQVSADRTVALVRVPLATRRS